MRAVASASSRTSLAGADAMRVLVGDSPGALRAPTTAPGDGRGAAGLAIALWRRGDTMRLRALVKAAVRRCGWNDPPEGWSVVVSESAAGALPIRLEGCAAVDLDMQTGAVLVTLGDGRCRWYPRVLEWGPAGDASSSSRTTGVLTSVPLCPDGALSVPVRMQPLGVELDDGASSPSSTPSFDLKQGSL